MTLRHLLGLVWSAHQLLMHVPACTLTKRAGRYQSTILGSYQTVELIDTFLNYQESIKRCMCIVHDPQRASQARHHPRSRQG